MYPDKDRAKRIILEIVRQAGGELGRTKIYKAFWLAHLIYDESEPGFLSDWPIVKMPNGPGIDDGKELLTELERAGLVETVPAQKGGHTEYGCRLVDSTPDLGFQEAETNAIRKAVEMVKEPTASRISEISHDVSRAWREAKMGDQLNIYADGESDDEYKARKEKLDNLFATMYELRE